MPFRLLVSRRQQTGALLAAASTCAVIVLAGGLADATPASFSRGAGSGALPGTALTLASVGSDGAPAQGQSGQAAIAEQGRYVAFSSPATLKVSASAPGVAAQPCNPKLSSCSNLYVRDRIGSTTTLLGKDAEAPTISATGRLVSYESDERSGDNTIFAVNRQATGTGAFDGPGNIAVHQVTGTAKDLQYERIPSCPEQFGNPGAMRTTPCGPKLSADGTTLVYPAQFSPISPDLRVDATVQVQCDCDSNGPLTEPISGNEFNFTQVIDNNTFNFTTAVLTYTVTGSHPITFEPPTPTGAFAISPVSGDNPPAYCGKDPTTGKDTTVQPNQSCAIEVTFNSPCSEGTLSNGTLQTNSAVPAGQSALALTAVTTGCIMSASAQRMGRLSHSRAAARPSRSRAASAVAQQTSCPAAPSGLALTAPPPQTTDNGNQSLIYLPDTEVNAPFVTGVKLLAGNFAGMPALQSPSETCAIQFIDGSAGVAALHLANPPPTGPNQVPPCTSTETIGGASNPQECIAYLLIDPGAVTTDVAAVGLESDGELVDNSYVSVTGVSRVIIARHDLSGIGNFGASASTVVSVDGKGTQIPGASQPSVSATGRYVAFTAPVPAGQPGMQVGGSTEVWRHDTDANGNGTFKPGPTMLVSCLPGPGPCAEAANADSPSLSGDGGREAFATMLAVALYNGKVDFGSAHHPLRQPVVGRARAAIPASTDQVDARNITAGTTVIVSATATGSGGDGFSYAPALSQDGSTVAFISAARNLTSVPVPNDATNLYVRTLAFGPVPNTELVTPNDASLPGDGDDIALPAIDAHGRIIAFQTSVQLLPAAPPGFHSVYTFERFPHLAFVPDPVNFGTLSTGSPAGTITVTVTDSGPGPATVTGISTTAPFGATASTCAGAVLHAGTSCQFIEQFAPHLAGHDNGSATVATTDDAEPTTTSSVPVTAIVLKPLLSVTPDVDYSGQVTLARGTGFPAGQTVTLSWSQGLGTATVTVTASGTSAVGGFSTPMVIFPDDIYGPRMLLAKNSSAQLLATAPFLAQVPPVEPPFTSGVTTP